MKIAFSKEQILEKLRFENSWWQTSEIGTHYSSMKKREYFKLLFPLITDRKVKRAVVLMGPRRVGKTVMLFQAMQELINNGVPAKNICYFSVETPIYNGIGLEELLNHFIEATENKSTNNLYVFFDEIQYLKDWEVHLKTLVDSYHSVKFIVSGSAAAALKLKSTESGAGRFTDFILPPLTFHEYLSLKGIEDLMKENAVYHEIDGRKVVTIRSFETNSITDLNNHFIDYINYGGYPEVSLSTDIQAEPGRYIKNDIIDKVLMKDLPILYGIEDVQELNSLFTYIAYNTGSEMSLDKISQSSSVSKQTIQKYISYLEAAFLIKVVHRIDYNAKKFKRANFFKIYLTNPSLRCALFSPIKEDDAFAGHLVETAIFSQWNHSESPLYYARWDKGEIDIVDLFGAEAPGWVVEIKWSNKCAENPKELDNVLSFCQKNSVNEISVTTYDVTKKENIQGLEITYVPSSIYCYTVGKNLVDGKAPGVFY